MDVDESSILVEGALTMYGTKRRTKLVAASRTQRIWNALRELKNDLIRFWSNMNSNPRTKATSRGTILTKFQ